MTRDLHWRALRIGSLLATMMASACSSDDAKPTAQDTERVLGTVNLALTAGSGIVINRVDYTVTSTDAQVVLTDHIDLVDPQATFYARFSLVAATGYTIRMTAQTTRGRGCSGEATFDVAAGATQQVFVDLLCEGENDGNSTGDVVIDGNIVTNPGTDCPDIAYVTAAPLGTSAGGAIGLTAGTTATGGEIRVGWSASQGTFAALDQANTIYTCAAAGNATLTFTVTRGAQCTDSETLQVTCLDPSLPTLDAGQTPSDAGSSVADAGFSVPEAGPDRGDASNETPDARTETPDARTELPDARAAAPDANAPDANTPDANTPVTETPDAGSVDYCEGLGSTCHVVDPGNGPISACHELGHDGVQTACQAQRSECVGLCGSALCQRLGNLCHDVDPGNGPLHDCHELGHGGNAQACFARGAECASLCEAAANSVP